MNNANPKAPTVSAGSTPPYKASKSSPRLPSTNAMARVPPEGPIVMPRHARRPTVKPRATDQHQPRQGDVVQLLDECLHAALRGRASLPAAEVYFTPASAS